MLIEKLMQQVQQYCDSTPSSYTTITDFLNAQHHYCAVKYNGQWYRGKLLDVKGQVMFKLFISVLMVFHCYTVGYSSDTSGLWAKCCH